MKPVDDAAPKKKKNYGNITDPIETPIHVIDTYSPHTAVTEVKSAPHIDQKKASIKRARRRGVGRGEGLEEG